MTHSWSGPFKLCFHRCSSLQEDLCRRYFSALASVFFMLSSCVEDDKNNNNNKLSSCVEEDKNNNNNNKKYIEKVAVICK